MNAQQEAVAYWKFCESRGLKPSISKAIRHLREYDIKVTDIKIRAWLASFAAQSPHPMQRQPRKSSTKHAQPARSTAPSPRLRAQNKVPLVPDVTPSLRSGPEETTAKKTTTLLVGEPPWTADVRTSVALMNPRTIVSLTPDERYALARFHALEFGGCTKSEATNRSRAQPIATGLHDLADRLSRAKRFEVNGKPEYRAILADVTVSEYIAYGRRIVARSSRLWYRPIDVIAEIEIEEPAHAARS